MMSSGLVVGIDVGTTKVCTVVGETFLGRDSMDVLGVGLAANAGMARGNVVDPHLVAEAIRSSVSAAESMADVAVDGALVSIGGDHLACQTEIGSSELGQRGQVTQEAIDAAIQHGSSVNLPLGRDVFHISPCEYSLDGRRGSTELLGAAGRHLQVELLVVTGATAARRELEECVRAARVEPRNFVINMIAASRSCLTEEERQTGVVLLDGGATQVGFFRRGALAHAGVIPVGGITITHDIAVCLGTTDEDAERLKITNGYASADYGDAEREVEFRDADTGELRAGSHRMLCEIIEARVEEILDLARERLMRSGCLSAAPCGIVLAGGGAGLRNLSDLARLKFGGMLVRRAEPLGVGVGREGLENPGTLTALGLALHAAELAREEIERRKAAGPVRNFIQSLKETVGIRR